VEDLDFADAHQEDPAVPAALTVSFDHCRCGPFEMELAVAELFLRPDDACSWHAGQRAILHRPLGWSGRGAIAGFHFPFCQRGLGAVEKDDRIRGRLPGLGRRAEGSRLDPLRLRPVAIVDRPRTGVVGWGTVKWIAGRDGSFTSRGEREQRRKGQHKDSDVHAVGGGEGFPGDAGWSALIQVDNFPVANRKLRASAEL
jgi:hypothetical protein